MPAGAKDSVRTTGSPAASEASRSTVATIAKSWWPSGSSTIWRTVQVRGPSAPAWRSIMSSCGEREVARTWTVRQVVNDPEGHRDWSIVATVDLDASDAAGEPVLRTRSFSSGP